MSDMYARKESRGLWALRQTRYKKHLAQGKEHPHDVCAIATSPSQLIEMCEKHWPDADYSAAKEAL